MLTLLRFGSEEPLQPDEDKMENWHHRRLSHDAALAVGWGKDAAMEMSWHTDYVDSYLYNPLWWFKGGLGRVKVSMSLKPTLIYIHFDDLTDAWQIRADVEPLPRRDARRGGVGGADGRTFAGAGRDGQAHRGHRVAPAASWRPSAACSSSTPAAAGHVPSGLADERLDRLLGLPVLPGRGPARQSGLEDPPRPAGRSDGVGAEGTGLAVNEWSVAAINVESGAPEVVARASHGWDTGGWVVDTRRNAFQ